MKRNNQEYADSFFKAAEDLRYLLSRDYPRTGTLTFVGNHYQLPRDEREILYRGVYPDSVAQARQNKLIPPESMEGRSIGVDGHNVLITLESALSGRVIVSCDDGVIRDTSGVSHAFRPTDLTLQALDLVLDHVVNYNMRSILFLLDAPMSLSGELASQISAAMSGRGIMGRARAVPDPDAELSSFPGIVATSDSILIDRVDEPIDLAGHIIRQIMPSNSFTQVKTQRN